MNSSRNDDVLLLRETYLNRFTFHETDSLARELSQFLQPSKSDSRIHDAATSLVDLATGPSNPGIILLYDGDPCAAIGFTREPGGTVAISQPVMFMNPSDRIQNVLYELLLKQVKRRAVDDGFLWLNFLNSETVNDAPLTQLLVELGFVLATEILLWECSVAGGTDEDSLRLLKPYDRRRITQQEFVIQDFDCSSTNIDGKRAIEKALDAILECSSDLSGQPRPKASELLAKWQSINANIFVCWVGQKIAAVMSCAANRFKSPASSEATTAERSCTTPMVTYVCIEYIGVIPDFRRKQTATWMIKSIPSLMLHTSSDATFPDLSEVTRIKAYSDAANNPATRLYQNCRFVQVARMQMWCCNLNIKVKN